MDQRGQVIGLDKCQYGISRSDFCLQRCPGDKSHRALCAAKKTGKVHRTRTPRVDHVCCGFLCRSRSCCRTCPKKLSRSVDNLRCQEGIRIVILIFRNQNRFPFQHTGHYRLSCPRQERMIGTQALFCQRRKKCTKSNARLHARITVVTADLQNMVHFFKADGLGQRVY